MLVEPAFESFARTYDAGEPGVFTITSFQRYCGGPCTPRWLAPPSERCSRRVRIGEGETVRVSIRLAFARGCTVAAHAS